MVINGKIIQECAKKVARISLEFSLDFAKAHPYISSTTITLLLLYLYIPGLFWFIVFSAGFVSFAKIYINIKNANAKNNIAEKTDEKSQESISSPKSKKKLVRNDAHARSVRRRRPRELPPAEEEEEKKTICSSSVEITPPVEDKSAVVEEAPKVIREVNVDTATSSPPRQTSPALNRWRSLRLKKFSSFRKSGDLEISDSDDEGDKEDNKKAVQWNENDQKNLVDLGLSEIERNQRLESLIARRRARKMFSLQVRRTLMNMDRSDPYSRMNPIQVPRNNHNFEKQSSGQFSPMPGSAPSFFRPNNPFDLPYDPQEEKPILTGGSFHQEFDLFSKHESFNLGSISGHTRVSSGEIFQDDNHSSLSRIRENLKTALGSDESDKIIQADPTSEIEIFADASGQRAPHPSFDLTDSYDLGQIQVEEEKGEEKKNNVETEMGSSESGRRAPHPSMDLTQEEEKESSEEEDDDDDDDDDMAISRIDRAAILETLASPLMQRNFSFKEEMSRNQNKMDDQDHDRFFFSQEGMYHKQNVSIASDMMVECSEIGSSPPLSPHGEEERSESRLRDIHEVGEAENVASIELNKPDHEDEKLVQESSTDNLQTYESMDVPSVERDLRPSEEDNPVYIVEHQTILQHPDEPDGENDNAQSSQDYEQQTTDQETISMEANDESFQVLPRSIAQNLNAAPHSSSPRSVLQPKFSMDPIHRSPSSLSEELQDETHDSVPVSRGLPGSDAEISQEQYSNPTSTSPESSPEEETSSRIHEHEPGGNIDAALGIDTADEIKEVDHIASMAAQDEALQPPETGRPAQED